MALFSEIYQASLRPHDPNKPLPDQTGYLDYPPTPPAWLVYYYYPPYHPDYHQTPPPPPPPPAGVSFVPFEQILPEVERSTKTESQIKRKPGSLLSSVVIWSTTFMFLALLMALAMLIVLSATGGAAQRYEGTTEPEPQLDIPAKPSGQVIKPSPSFEQASLPMAALSIDRSGALPIGTRPPRPGAQGRHSFSEAIPGISPTRPDVHVDKKHGGGKPM